MLLMDREEAAAINRKKLIKVENGDYEGATTTSNFVAQIAQVLLEREGKRILGLIAYNLVIIYCLCNWVTSTNSIALSAYVNTICFNVLALLVCLISIWVEKNGPANRNFRKKSRPISIFEQSRFPKAPRYPEYSQSFGPHSQTSLEHSRHEKFRKTRPLDAGEKNEKLGKDESAEDENFVCNSITSLGLEKYEVLALLVSSCLSLVAGSLISVQVVARLTDQPRVNTGRLGLGALLGFLAHLGTIIGYPDAGLNHVVCKALPCPTLRGCNPILGGNMMSALILSGTHLAVHFWEIHVTDTAAAFAVLGLTAMSMLPLAFFTSSVILQKLPRHMCDELDKCLREALVIDGVLEFRNERFWTKSFGKLAGSLEVRIRRNANENHVLESVTLRLSKIVSTLTIQEFREFRINELTSHHHPTEYYIDEILSPCDKKINDTSRRTSDRTFDHDINRRVSLSRSAVTVQAGHSRIDASPTQRSKTRVSKDKRCDARTGIEVAQETMKNFTILKNDNILFKDYLWRGRTTTKNPLVNGTKIDFESFHRLFMPRQNSGSNNDA